MCIKGSLSGEGGTGDEVISTDNVPRDIQKQNPSP
jgi:hypothetical protein